MLQLSKKDVRTKQNFFKMLYIIKVDFIDMFIVHICMKYRFLLD